MDVSIHEAFHQARAQTNLPRSKILPQRPTTDSKNAANASSVNVVSPTPVALTDSSSSILNSSISSDSQISLPQAQIPAPVAKVPSPPVPAHVTVQQVQAPAPPQRQAPSPPTAVPTFPSSPGLPAMEYQQPPPPYPVQHHPSYPRTSAQAISPNVARQQTLSQPEKRFVSPLQPQLPPHRRAAPPPRPPRAPESEPYFTGYGAYGTNQYGQYNDPDPFYADPPVIVRAQSPSLGPLVIPSQLQLKRSTRKRPISRQGREAPETPIQQPTMDYRLPSDMRQMQPPSPRPSLADLDLPPSDRRRSRGRRQSRKRAGTTSSTSSRAGQQYRDYQVDSTGSDEDDDEDDVQDYRPSIPSILSKYYHGPQQESGTPTLLRDPRTWLGMTRSPKTTASTESFRSIGAASTEVAYLRSPPQEKEQKGPLRKVKDDVPKDRGSFLLDPSWRSYLDDHIANISSLDIVSYLLMFPSIDWVFEADTRPQNTPSTPTASVASNAAGKRPVRSGAARAARREFAMGNAF
jgi:hypothetical protein